MSDQQTVSPIMKHFVLKEPREKQIVAANYIDLKWSEGYDHIVIAAPTGSGKSALGATACFWSQEVDAPEFSAGGYYLVTQKMLQDQLQDDFPKYVNNNAFFRCQSIKSASEYTCRVHGNCAIGMTSKPPCGAVKQRICTYKQQREAWENAITSVTNYPYMFTEHAFCGNLKPRKVLVLDECHSIERQLLKFVEITLNQETLEKFAPTLKEIPAFDSVVEFAEFIEADYLPILERRLDVLMAYDDGGSPEGEKMKREKVELENHYSRTIKGVIAIKENPDNWVFWQETNRKGQKESLAKPLDASPFGEGLCFEMGRVRVHMSAYPGSKKLYCESLGLDPDRVAWLNLNSTFPVCNREIYMTLIGSMSRKNREQTLPEMLDFIEKIMESYPEQKGIIHCNSYEVGTAIYDKLLRTPHGHRLLYAKSSDDRDPVYVQHKMAKIGSIIISPSMTEGFDFAGDLARWQVIAKCPFPYLGDKQVAAKKEMSQEWYALQTVMSIIQACGRVVRSDTDVGHTYILDSDFLGLFDRYAYMFPRWWTDALVWPKGR